jgi:hypothetical protein
MTVTDLCHEATLAQLKYFGRATGRRKVKQLARSIAFKKSQSALGIRLFKLTRVHRQPEHYQA